MNILITGANGFLSQHLIHYLFSHTSHKIIATGKGENRNTKVTALHYFPVELTNKNDVEKLIFDVQADTIVHAAAMSKPDECNNNREACLLNNVESTKNLLQTFKKSKSPNPLFIYVSTDFIFGENGPHSEDDISAPLNFYGESKLIAEQLVMESGVRYVIIRPVFIYGPVWMGMRPSFLHWIKNNLEANKNCKVMSDQFRTPTYVYDICKGIETIIQQNKDGAYHLAGKDILSPHQMALITARVLNLNSSLIEAVTSETFPEPVRRAKRSGLKIEKAIRELNYTPVSFEQGVRLTFGIKDD